jgi:signal peptidase II
LELVNTNPETPKVEQAPSKRAATYWLIASAIIFAILLFDQVLKIWVKTTMELNTEIPVFGDWFLLHFTENPGMAFGLELGGKYGKLLLTVFRILAVGFGFWILIHQIKKRAKIGFIVCISLILAGAIGNIIDSVFYGVVFQDINRYSGGWLHGRVVDMLYFPLIEGHYPNWIPWKGGDFFIFFSPVFNIADAAISTGVIAILVFQKRFFPTEEKIETQTEEPVALFEDQSGNSEDLEKNL